MIKMCVSDIIKQVMKMYPYHNVIKRRIKNGELVGFEYVENYKDIGKCLLLHFKTYPFERPIRPHKYAEYDKLLRKLGNN